MKTEKEIEASIKRVRNNIEPTFNTALDQFNNEQYSECYETLSTIMANVAALEAAERILG